MWWELKRKRKAWDEKVRKGTLVLKKISVTVQFKNVQDVV